MDRPGSDPFPVLLVEDDPAHAQLVLRSLAAHGPACDIRHVDNGEAALDYLAGRGVYADRERHPRPRLVLLDLRLPRVGGLEVLRRIRDDAALATLPVVVLTTSCADSDVDCAYDLDANSFLVKPIDFDRFEQLMRELGRYWMEFNRAPALEAAA